ncbi:unnamed protein product [Darwinula stevensoni]|uniref:Uncharacterized protein n=1 Tax=Darwinula stevensoni TaxID=69355 RepID=A0A7R9AIU1_9CRUS|nr:unnamed protein product [Darwinula stevensoni]CAG0906433.1 unnamed protein product [Darwinula stevensoni]
MPGDVGGPFMSETEAGFYQQVGIISSPHKECQHLVGGISLKTANYVNGFIKPNTQDGVWCSAAER